MVKKQPFVQIRIGKEPPLWQWVFLSTIYAKFVAYDVERASVLAEGSFPPQTFRQYCAKYGVGRKSTCKKEGNFDLKSWLMTEDGLFFSEQYIVAYTGKHSEFEDHKPTMTDAYFECADHNAIEKLVSHIARSIPVE